MDLYNTLNNQFTLEYFLISKNFTRDIIDYAKTNGIDINYICYFKILYENKYYILTPNTRKCVGYRLLIIDRKEKDNNITDYRKFNVSPFIQIDINYNRINIKISKQCDTLKDIFTMHPFLKQKYNNALIFSISSDNGIKKCSTSLNNAFSYDKNSDISNISIGKNLTKLGLLSIIPFKSITFGKTITLPSYILPYISNLEYLSFNSINNIYFLPETLKTLIIGNFDKDIILPASLLYLEIGYARLIQLPERLEVYNKPLNISHCINLKTLILNNFNQKLLPGWLPKSIEYIRLDKFNQELDVNTFESCTLLNYLSLKSFNQKLLPIFSDCNLLKKIAFGMFNQEIEIGVLPASLEEIIFGNSYVIPINSNIFVNPTRITISRTVEVINPDNLLITYLL